MTQAAGASEAIETAAAEGPPSTAARSSGSSFYTAMRVLPAPQRDAMYEIYAFCRAVDDIADGEAPQAERRAGLERWRADIDRLYAGEPPAGLGRLAATAQRFGLAREDFLAVIDGMEMDVEQDIRAPDFATLDLYCDRVASAVGRLSVRIFGLGEAEGRDLAHELGRALQLTNILRDLDEDAAVGRLYLPREALEDAGIAARDPAAVLADPALDRACAVVAARARGHFAAAGAIIARCPRRATLAPRLMAKVYRHILERMTRQGWRAPRQRVKIGRARLLWMLLADRFF
ncbi:MAG TPA: presqualene diphosphate synthase HpnD [Dongiaceae bacterium]